MNTSAQYRALVVDDELVVRQATMRALSGNGFTCESAQNGAVALEMIKKERYDLVVSDLRMPETNGHQLSVDLLEMPSRPAILILTGVIEPKISNDLRIRGVDEILFKPVDFRVLAQKAKHLVEQRAAAQSSDLNGSKQGISSETPPTTSGSEQPAAAHPAVSQMAQAARSFGSPPKDFDGFAKASANTFSTHDLAQAMEVDPKVALQVLHFANRVLYKSQQAIAELQRSIATKQQFAVVGGIIIFAAGALAGWLLSWLGTGDGTLR